MTTKTEAQEPKLAHTPGVWKLSNTGLLTNEGQRAVIGHEKRIALVDMQREDLKRGERWNGDDPVRDANAALIASAPELLEAARALVNSSDYDDEQPLVKALKAAIAKATRAEGTEQRWKLSEAIMLGDSLKKPNAYIFLTPDGSCGCAIGGALLASGVIPETSGFITDTCASLWPWLTCQQRADIGWMYIKVTAGFMTLEQLCDEVKKMEPAEDADAARVLGERDHAQIGEVPDSQDGRAELLRVSREGTRP